MTFRTWGLLQAVGKKNVFYFFPQPGKGLLVEVSSLILFPIRTVHWTNFFFNYYWQQFVAVLSTHVQITVSLAGKCPGGGEGTKDTEYFAHIPVSEKPSATSGWLLWLRVGQGRAPHSCARAALQHCAHLKTAFSRGRAKPGSQIHTPCSSDQDRQALRCNDFHHHLWSRSHFSPQFSLVPGSWILQSENVLNTKIIW